MLSATVRKLPLATRATTNLLRAFGTKPPITLPPRPRTLSPHRTISSKTVAAMSDDEADPDLLAFLRQHFQGKLNIAESDPETGVLEGAEAIVDDAIDVAIVMRATKDAASAIHAQMKLRNYSTATWASHELHPTSRNDSTVAFIFTMDLLNFSFWSDNSCEEDGFGIEYDGKVWNGYWGLVAALRRACDEGIPITSPDFWQSKDECTLDALKHVFRSCTGNQMPMIEERLACLREAGRVLYEKYDCDPVNLVLAAKGSAARLVNILAQDFACFRDEFKWSPHRRKPVRFLKRAQIFAADLWACFEGCGPGEFRDIDKITMFADYRVPQILNTLGCLYYSPKLAATIAAKETIPSGHSWEMQLRACSIWCVELIKREILRTHPEARVNAILIDFFLYDTIKEMEVEGKETVPHHRTRSIWY